MKTKNPALQWLAAIFAIVGLLVSMPVSYYWQNPIMRAMWEMSGKSMGDYLAAIPSFYAHDASEDVAQLGHTLAWTAIVCTIGGFVLGLLVKLVIKAAQQPAAATSKP